MQFTQISQCQLENKEQQFRFMLNFKELYAETKEELWGSGQGIDSERTAKHCASTGFCILILLQPSYAVLAWLSKMMKPRPFAFTRVCIVTSKMKMPDCSNPSHSKTS